MKNYSYLCIGFCTIMKNAHCVSARSVTAGRNRQLDFGYYDGRRVRL